ncbi:MAG: ABC transporter ATP-binding protein [Promethearchaeota archaeon]
MNHSKEVIIETHQLTKYFGSIVALDQLNLKIKSGVIALLGQNGAGKTTLLKLLLGLLRPSLGTAQVLGFDSRHESLSIRKKVGVLHEKPYFPKTFTPYRFLQLVGRIYNISSVENRSEEVLKIVGLWNDRERRIGHFSAGMIQRLGLAQAILPQPQLIFLDEPTANLDPIGRVSILNLVSELARDHGISFLISSHILADLERVCNHMIIIHQGQLLIEGSINDFFTRTKSSFITIKSFEDEIETLVKGLPGVLRTCRIDNVSIEVEVKDISVFESAFFKLVTEENIRIESFRIENNLERIYIQTIQAIEEKAD